MKTQEHTLLENFEHNSRLISGFKIRKSRFNEEWGYKGYDDFPTHHDKYDGARFLTFSETDETGEDIVFGMRRIIPALKYGEKTKIGTLPFETRYMLTQQKDYEKNLNKYFSMKNIFPKFKDFSTLNFAEIGGFCIDTNLTKLLFKTRKAYQDALDEIYFQTLNVAKNMNVDIAIVFAQQKNLNKQHKWLQTQKYEYHIAKELQKLYIPFMSGDTPLIINLNAKVKLHELTSCDANSF